MSTPGLEHIKRQHCTLCTSPTISMTLQFERLHDSKVQFPVPEWLPSLQQRCHVAALGCCGSLAQAQLQFQMSSHCSYKVLWETESFLLGELQEVGSFQVPGCLTLCLLLGGKGSPAPASLLQRHGSASSLSHCWPQLDCPGQCEH